MGRLIILLFLFYIIKINIAIMVRKFVDQKDMSERCKRRVMPSVFLGKRVMEANSHVLHFAQLEVPYSCSLSVRAESGYSIIMIIQLLPEDNLHEACSRNQDQLIVYELGETFGGYWGNLPDAVIKQTPRNHTSFYTLKTTKSTTRIQNTTYTEETEGSVLKQSFPVTDKEADEYIRIEVPLVNVSGNLQLGGPLRRPGNVEEMFDFIYDVTPRNGVEYRTSIMPLVQFSIRQQGGRDRYELDYDLSGITFNPRNYLSTHKKRYPFRNNKWFSNRRFNTQNKKKGLFSRKYTTVQRYFKPQPEFMPSSEIKHTTRMIPTLDSKYATVSWKHIEDIIRYMNKTSAPTESVKMNNIMKKISDMQHNLSAYLIPNITGYGENDHFRDSNNIKINFPSIPVISQFTRKELGRNLLSPNKLWEFKTTTPTAHSIEISVKEIDTATNITNFTIVQNESSILKKETLKYVTIVDKNDISTESIRVNKIEIDDVTEALGASIGTPKMCRNGTLVDHESWENLVQAAPVMAVILNKTERKFQTISNKTTQLNLNTIDKSIKRKLQNKRHINALEIEKSRPRNLTTKRLMTTKTDPTYKLAEMQDLARLVELQDDEIEGRVALRYLRNYVGSMLFNICQHEDSSRHMFLFNTSRIVIAVSNFTLNRMMVVLTPAIALPSNTSRCPSEHLECQITGTRVCIDSMNACDGIPNCGSYEIYDEDRLVCGLKGVQHNVYLAAFAFLAVLLTMLYTVHYWLKRCVPGVSEAFFVYADASENTLFLDTIMRSPNDVDNDSFKCAYSSHFFDEEFFHNHIEPETKDNVCSKLFKKCCGILFCTKIRAKKQSQETPKEKDTKVSEMYSFTELELRKYTASYTKNQAVQTGASIDDVKEIKKNKKDSTDVQNYAKRKIKIIKDQTYQDKKQADELNLIKLIKEVKSSSTQSDSIKIEQAPAKLHRRHAIAGDEKELKSTVYERHSNTSSIPSQNIPVTCEIHPERQKRLIDRADTSKHLRFDESPTMIPTANLDDDDIIETIAGTSGKNKDRNLDSNIQETSSITRDFMRYWSSKGKKGRKKEKQLGIR